MRWRFFRLTTGLSRNSTFLYLIGAVAYEENNWQMYQWMIENEEEEPELPGVVVPEEPEL